MRGVFVCMGGLVCVWGEGRGGRCVWLWVYVCVSVCVFVRVSECVRVYVCVCVRGWEEEERWWLSCPLLLLPCLVFSCLVLPYVTLFSFLIYSPNSLIFLSLLSPAWLYMQVMTISALEQGKNVLVDGSLRDASWYLSYIRYTHTRMDVYSHTDMHAYSYACMNICT